MARTFANSTARLAYPVDPIYEAGRRMQWKQIDTGVFYAAIRGGTGADCWEQLYDSVDLTNTICLSLNDFREVDANSDVGAIAANGGILASDTTPILRGDAAETQEISWAAAGVDPIAAHITLPFDFDGASIMNVFLDVYSGTTNGASFNVEVGFDGGALVLVAADDAATKSATRHRVTVAIPAASIPDTAKNLTLVLTPPAHATDAIQLVGCSLGYERLAVS